MAQVSGADGASDTALGSVRGTHWARDDMAALGSGCRTHVPPRYVLCEASARRPLDLGWSETIVTWVGALRGARSLDNPPRTQPKHLPNSKLLCAERTTTAIFAKQLEGQIQCATHRGRKHKFAEFDAPMRGTQNNR